MKKLTVFLLLFVLICSESNFLRTFEDLSGGTGYLRIENVAKFSDDSGFFFIGRSKTQSNNPSIIGRCDRMGNPVWLKVSTRNHLSTITLNKNETKVIVAGGPEWYYGQAFAMQIDLEGNIEWARSYASATYDIINCITQSSDGNYLLAGIFGDFGGLLRISSSDGTIIRSKQITKKSLARVVFTSIVEGKNGKIYASGYSGHYPATDFFRFSSNLELEEANEITGMPFYFYATTMIIASDGNLVFTATSYYDNAHYYPVLGKLDPTNLQLVWWMVYNYVDSDDRIGRLMEGATGVMEVSDGYIVSSDCFSADTGGHVFKVSLNGSVVNWVAYIDDITFYDLTEYDDGILIVGRKSSHIYAIAKTSDLSFGGIGGSVSISPTNFVGEEISSSLTQTDVFDDMTNGTMYISADISGEGFLSDNRVGELSITSSYVSEFSCYGTASDEEGVCGGKGVCVEEDHCVCESGYSGECASMTICDSWESVDPLNSGSVPTLISSNSKLEGNLLKLEFSQPVTTGRSSFKQIFGGLEDVEICNSWKNDYWIQSVENCTQLDNGELPWGEIVDNCGFELTESDTEYEYSGYIDYRLIEKLGDEITREMDWSYKLVVRIPKVVLIDSTVNIFAPVDSSSYLVGQDFDVTGLSGYFEYLTVFSSPYIITFDSIIESPSGVDLVVSEGESSCESGSDCKQNWRMDLNVSGVCSISGTFRYQFLLNCRSGVTDCPYTDESVIVESVITSENFCTSIDIDVQLTGTLTSYLSDSEKTAFTTEETMDFEVVISSPEVELESVTAVDVWVTRSTGNWSKNLLVSKVLTFDGETSNLVYSSVDSDKMQFSFDASILPADTDPFQSYDVHAKVEVEYTFQGRRRTITSSLEQQGLTVSTEIAVYESFGFVSFFSVVVMLFVMFILM